MTIYLICCFYSNGNISTLCPISFYKFFVSFNQNVIKGSSGFGANHRPSWFSSCQTIGDWEIISASGNSFNDKVIANKQKSIQVAYTTGGATLGIAQAEVDNSDYTAGRAESQTVVSLAISF